VKIECLDWTGGQIKNNDSADDVKNVDLTQVHYLSGPFEIETAEPGDVLLVEIQDVQPFEDSPWGFTGVFSKDNGGGFLDEIYPEAYVPLSIDISSCLEFGIANRSSLGNAVPKRSRTLKESSAHHDTSLAFVSPASFTLESSVVLHHPKSSPSGTGEKPS